MSFEEFIGENEWILRILYSLVALCFSILIYQLIAHIIDNKIDNKKNSLVTNKKYNTYLKLMKSVMKYIFMLITLFIILRINGVNISSLIAGVGIVGIVFSFAIQDAVKDILKGIDIISDNYYQVGDIIKFQDLTGKVLAIGLKTTKIQDIYTLNIASISNRNIEKVEVISHLINIDIPLPYELKLQDAEKIIKYTVKKVKNLKEVEEVEYRGVNNFSESSIDYQIKVYCQPSVKVQTRRDALTCILACLEEHNIQIPYKQIDIHQK